MTPSAETLCLPFAGTDLELHPAGALLWPEESLLAVADLHLEKGSSFAPTGQLLPPYDSEDTLERLVTLAGALGYRRILLLGDTLHDSRGPSRLSTAATALWEQLTDLAEIIWVRGNHDGPTTLPSVTACHQWQKNGLTFLHELDPEGHEQIAGHHHPVARLTHRGTTVRRKCFVEDGNRLILPAFGTYTGGLDVRDPAIEILMQGEWRAHIVTRDRLVSVPGHKLVKPAMPASAP
ncbi:ligase-associated DNA damage response endonuclease PdeM [Eilatimonas milleporae]|uniref:Putative phosphoesterase n=1 Tax=Eilatimonas milleporae TaxID=911205 RepID=A0A3M0CGR1_9PROT|nr:ligase-associated DNA damage response endonuclease PdeM [Eilatimonas milleporae]RMB07710.1 putative phosphoesterase [Eilatimonas milleporae]